MTGRSSILKAAVARQKTCTTTNLIGLWRHTPNVTNGSFPNAEISGFNGAFLQIDRCAHGNIHFEEFWKS